MGLFKADYDYALTIHFIVSAYAVKHAITKLILSDAEAVLGTFELCRCAPPVRFCVSANKNHKGLLLLSSVPLR